MNDLSPAGVTLLTWLYLLALIAIVAAAMAAF